VRKLCRILLERPRRVTRGGYGSGIPITWAEFKAEMLREDLERWAEDERMAEKEG
jgi:hypothetical protein